MNANNHELFRGILSHIYHLRNDLKKLEEREPTLFEGDEQPINSHWEFWSTDEVLERIYKDIEYVLKESENLSSKAEVEKVLKGNNQ